MFVGSLWHLLSSSLKVISCPWSKGSHGNSFIFSVLSSLKGVLPLLLTEVLTQKPQTKEIVTLRKLFEISRRISALVKSFFVC